MKQIFSILFSFILLASHINLTMGTHLCGGETVESKIMFGETHLGCGMAEMEDPCDNSEYTNNDQVSFDKFPCCANEFQTIQSTDEFIKDAQTTINVDFAVEYIYSTLNLDLLTKTTNQFHTEYNSPSIEKDIQVLFQTFLI